MRSLSNFVALTIAAVLGLSTAGTASAQAGRNDPVIRALRALLGDRLSTSAAVCEQHGQAEAYHPSVPPDAVAFHTSPKPPEPMRSSSTYPCIGSAPLVSWKTIEA